jgi:hypothetical protein
VYQILEDRALILGPVFVIGGEPNGSRKKIKPLAF